MLGEADFQDDVLNEDSYDSLVSVLEASQGMLSLLLASCEPGTFQEQLIERYEVELAPEMHCYRVKLNQVEPSLTAALEQLVHERPELKEAYASAAITVTGIADLLDTTMGETDKRSALDKFFGYLQWTREGLRAFSFPIVLWVTPQILRQMGKAAPDFWSWRNGVFRFAPPKVEESIAVSTATQEEVPQLILHNRFSSLSVDELLEQVESIKAQGNALPALASLYDRLGQAYASRVKLNQSENLEYATEQAIAFFTQAIEIEAKLHRKSDRVNTLIRLGQLYSDIGRNQLAQTVYQQALKISREIGDRIGEASSLSGLGNIYQQPTLDQAETIANLASAYLQSLQGDRAENIEQAIAAYQSALQIYTRADFPLEWAAIQNNLAIAYSRHVKGDRVENIEKAIAAYHLALQVYTRERFPIDWATTQNNLAVAYSNRIRGDRAENLKRAIAAYQLALQIRTPDTLQRDCRLTAQNLGNLFFEQQDWVAATEAYSTALTAAESLYQSCIFTDSQAAELAESPTLTSRMAYALARKAEFSQAVEVIERGRARKLGDNLDRNRANLSQLQQTNPDLFAQYKDITAQLRSIEVQQRSQAYLETSQSFTRENPRLEALHLRQTFDELIGQIRQIQGYEEFLTLPVFEDIVRVVQRNKPLAYLLTTPTGSLALIVTLDGTVELWLDDLIESVLQKLFDTWLDIYNQPQANQFQADHPAWPDAIDQGMRELWHLLMAPLVSYLNRNNFQKATLITTGLLSFFPLHAAWVENLNAPSGRRYALDNICFNYVPSARSLRAAYQVAQQTQADSMLAVDDPLLDLPNASREVMAAISTFSQNKVLQHEKASVESVLDAFPKYNVLHLCCHGISNLLSPLESGLVMNDGLLTLRDILALQHSNIRLVILSADETGIPGIDLPNEVIGLPAGLLQLGAAGIVAPFWTVSDYSTMLLFTRFYHLWRMENLEIIYALSQAQKWVRDTTNKEKLVYLRRSLSKSVKSNESDSDVMTGNGLPPDVAEYLYKSLILADPDSRDFSHPFHWAAFSYIGA